MRKVGAKRQTDLIRLILSVAAGDVPDAQDLAHLTSDIFGLTARQSQLALLIAHGTTRDRAAELLSVSTHAAKSDLKIVFEACGVASAVDLSRVMAEMNALKGLASACEVSVRANNRADEPLRLIPRSTREGRIAVSDHGPVSGKPVLLFHSNVSGRHHSRSFIAALRDAGFRPIAVERAGFGLSSALEGDPVTHGVDDMVEVLDALGLAKAAIVARCTTASLVALAAEATGRVSGGVLVWPDPPPRADRPEKRMSHRARAIFVRYPQLARPFVKVLTRRTNVAMIEKLWRKSAAGIAADEAVMESDAERTDIVRGAQQAILGMEGFLSEALALEAGPSPTRLIDAQTWSVIFGSGYESYDTSDAAAFWGDAMPGARIEIVESGVHFLHVTHTPLVIEALHRATS